MVKEIFFDTNVFLKVFLNEDSIQPLIEIFKSVEEKRISGYLSIVSLAELVTIFVRKKDDKSLEEVITWLYRNFNIVQTTSEIAILAGHLKAKYSTSKSSFSFADSIIAASCLIYGTSFLTFDKEFDQVQEINKIEPSKIQN